MSALGDLLELLHGATERYDTVRLELREWRHTAGSERAFARWRASLERRGAAFLSVELPGTDVPPDARESRERIWWERPDRLRQERTDGASGARLLVKDGPRWWSHDDWQGSVTNLGSHLDVESGEIPPRPELLQPVVWLAWVTLEPTGSAEVAGREAVLVRARPRRLRDDDGEYGVPRLAPGADAHELAVDAERGVVLRIASFIDDAPFVVTEVERIAFDERLPPETFVFTPPPGEELRPVVAPPRDVTLDEAAREAPFTVLAPRRVPDGAEVRVSYASGSDRPPEDPCVLLHYATPDLGLKVTISLSPARPDGDLDIAEPAGEVVRDGRVMRVRDLGGNRQVALESHGTRAMLMSDSAPLETLLQMAASLAPAPAEPPRLQDAS